MGLWNPPTSVRLRRNTDRPLATVCCSVSIHWRRYIDRIPYRRSAGNRAVVVGPWENTHGRYVSCFSWHVASNIEDVFLRMTDKYRLRLKIVILGYLGTFRATFSALDSVQVRKRKLHPCTGPEALLHSVRPKGKVIIIYLLTAIGLSPGGSGYFTCV